MYDIQISVTPVRLFKQLIFLFSFLLKVQVVLISVAILLFLFSVQRFGTDKVGYSFAPILSVWFLLITVIGIYNLAVHDPTVLKAFNLMCILYYFRRNGKEAWLSLGGVVLCTTGTDAERFIFDRYHA
jgi:KUP system potassium uptake protein